MTGATLQAIVILAALLSLASIQPPEGVVELPKEGGEGLYLPVPPGSYRYEAVEIAEGYLAALLYMNAEEARLERGPAGIAGAAVLPGECSLLSMGVEPESLSSLAAYRLEPLEGSCRVELWIAAAAAPAGPLAVYAASGEAAAILVVYPVASGGGAELEPGVAEAPQESPLPGEGVSSPGGDGGRVWGESRWLPLAISLAVLAVAVVAELGVQRR